MFFIFHFFKTFGRGGDGANPAPSQDKIPNISMIPILKNYCNDKLDLWALALQIQCKNQSTPPGPIDHRLMQTGTQNVRRGYCAKLGCPAKPVSIRNNRKWNRNQFWHYPKQNVCFSCFASLPKQRVSVFRLNQNKKTYKPKHRIFAESNFFNSTKKVLPHFGSIKP